MYSEVKGITPLTIQERIMFVQSVDTTNPKHVNGIAIEQRRGMRETLVQWSNGDVRWVLTGSLAGDVKLIGSNHRMDIDNIPNYGSEDLNG